MSEPLIPSFQPPPQQHDQASDALRVTARRAARSSWIIPIATVAVSTVFCFGLAMLGILLMRSLPAPSPKTDLVFAGAVWFWEITIVISCIIGLVQGSRALRLAKRVGVPEVATDAWMGILIGIGIPLVPLIIYVLLHI